MLRRFNSYKTQDSLMVEIEVDMALRGLVQARIVAGCECQSLHAYAYVIIVLKIKLFVRS